MIRVGMEVEGVAAEVYVEGVHENKAGMGGSRLGWVLQVGFKTCLSKHFGNVIFETENKASSSDALSWPRFS